MNLLKLFTGNYCPVCGKMIETDRPLCKDCNKSEAYSPYKQILDGGFECISAFEHYGVFRRVMLDYKYYGQKEYCDNYAMLLSEIIDKYYDHIPFDYYTSVPSYGEQKKYGFEKVRSIAKEAAHLQRVKYRQLLIQKKQRKKQHLLTGEERTENVKGIFTVAPNTNINGKNILIFDDVVTTGATLNECCKILKENGAQQICCITVNHALKDNDTVTDTSKQ